MDDLTHIDKSIRELLDSDISSNALSRKADMALSAVSRMRSGKIDIENVRWHNIKKLYSIAKQQDGRQ